MSLKDQMARDALGCFLNTSEFAEEISYIPKNDIAKIIKAVVVRGQIKPEQIDSQRLLHNRIEVFIANSASIGVATVSLEDAIVAKDMAGNDVEWGIIDVIYKDDGMWHLLAEK